MVGVRSARRQGFPTALRGRIVGHRPVGGRQQRRSSRTHQRVGHVEASRGAPGAFVSDGVARPHGPVVGRVRRQRIGERHGVAVGTQARHVDERRAEVGVFRHDQVILDGRANRLPDEARRGRRDERQVCRLAQDRGIRRRRVDGERPDHAPVTRDAHIIDRAHAPVVLAVRQRIGGVRVRVLSRFDVLHRAAEVAVVIDLDLVGVRPTRRQQFPVELGRGIGRHQQVRRGEQHDARRGRRRDRQRPDRHPAVVRATEPSAGVNAHGPGVLAFIQRRRGLEHEVRTGVGHRRGAVEFELVRHRAGHALPAEDRLSVGREVPVLGQPVQRQFEGGRRAPAAQTAAPVDGLHLPVVDTVGQRLVVGYDVVGSRVGASTDVYRAGEVGIVVHPDHVLDRMRDCTPGEARRRVADDGAVARRVQDRRAEPGRVDCN